jgi:antirestriction protein ArdC
MATQKQFEAITSTIIEALEAGTVPWHKPWNTPAGNQFPHNAITGKRYRGLNVFNLWAIAAKNGYESQAWLSYKQAESLGGNVKKGERGRFIQFWKFNITKTGETDTEGKPIAKKSFVFRMYRVFNVEQCENLKLPKRELICDCGDCEGDRVKAADDFDAIAEAEAIADAYIANGGPTVTHNGGDRAFYSPAEHSIHLPKQAQFESSEEYYSTKFHELTHSTGHKSLLGRFAEDSGPAHFGSERYSKEELVGYHLPHRGWVQGIALA